MQIIKDQQLTENTFTFIAEGAPISNGDVTVGLNRWLAEKSALSSHEGKVGIRLTTTDDLEQISGDLADLALVEIEFPGFGDGRAFSQARLLRSKYAYHGEIRAVGNFLPDQVYFLARVGFNAFDLNNEADKTLALSAMNDFSVNYQPSSN